MKNVYLRGFAIVILSLPLSACQSFPLFGIGKARSASTHERALAANEGADALIELGRRHLDENQMGAAIATFQTALAAGEDPGQALNGMGVAYAKLGRLDAAERLFAKALALDPSSERYAQNLQKVNSATAFAMSRRQPEVRTLEATALAARAEAVMTNAPALEKVTGQSTPGRLLRKSAREVAIETTIRSRGGPLPTVDSRFKAAVRIDLTQVQATASDPKSVPALVHRVDPRFKPIVRIPPPG